MKKLVSTMMVLVGMFVFSSNLAFADGKDKKVEFKQDVVVNGTVVKKGKYQIKFDETTNQMSIWQGDKLVGQAAAHKGFRQTKAITTQVLSSKQNDSNVLRGIIFEDEQETILLNTDNTVNVSPQ
jgi:hypothetical protein